MLTNDEITTLLERIEYLIRDGENSLAVSEVADALDVDCLIGHDG